MSAIWFWLRYNSVSAVKCRSGPMSAIWWWLNGLGWVGWGRGQRLSSAATHAQFFVMGCQTPLQQTD